jgi:hypothetical protein
MSSREISLRIESSQGQLDTVYIDNLGRSFDDKVGSGFLQGIFNAKTKVIGRISSSMHNGLKS